MRTHKLAGFAAPLAVLFLAATTGCGAASEDPPNLMEEYFRSDEVVNDPFDTGTCCEDRMAGLASLGPPEAVLGSLLGAIPCEDESGCVLTEAASLASDAFAGSDGAQYSRGLLVKQDGGPLEYTTLIVAENADGDAVLVDVDGSKYDSLDDFRSGNDTYDSDDWIMAAENITEVEGRNEIVTVSGHTAPVWVRWLIGGAVAAVVLVLAVGVAIRVRYHRAQVRPEEPR